MMSKRKKSLIAWIIHPIENELSWDKETNSFANLYSASRWKWAKHWKDLEPKKVRITIEEVDDE